jgi:nucleoside-diphosphate-sugar epimerase
MKAFVTGGTGFIGSPVVDLLLAEGHAVRLFSRSPRLPERLLNQQNIELAMGDLIDFDAVTGAMKGSDVFIHIGEIKNRTDVDARNNTTLIERITADLAMKGVQRIVFISAISVAGVPSKVPASEETPPESVPNDHYTAYKHEAERIISRTHDTEYVILRPAPVYGPGSRHLGRLVSLIGLIGPIGIPFPGSGKNIVPLVHVRDLAQAVVLAATRREATGQVFTIADGLRHTWHDFLSAVAAAQGKSLNLFPLPPQIAFLAAPFMDIAASMLGVAPDHASYARFFSSDLLFDIGKSRRLLGWAPIRTDLDAAVQEMVAAYQGAGHSRSGES